MNLLVITKEESFATFDKVIWAAGDNSIPNDPINYLFFKWASIPYYFYDAKLEGNLNGKWVLLIGGSYSAEDLALIKARV